MLLNKIKSFLTAENIFVCLILLGGFILRIYKINTLLDFHYDQGRDALVIWDFIHNGKFFLIGPTTGIEGIFRGPWYYWLITPFYLIGKGNPVYPSIFLSLTTIVGSYLAFLLGKKAGGSKTGFIALIVTSLSAGIILSSRWLSNPTPMFAISMLTVWSLYLFSQGKKWGLILAGFLAGMAMQFGSSGEIFYFPAIIVYLLILSKKKLNLKLIVYSILAVGISFVPQIIFDLRHERILTQGIINFLTQEKAIEYSLSEIIKVRLSLYWQVFSNNLWLGDHRVLAPFIAVSIYSLIVNFKTLWKSEIFKIVFIFSLSPILGLTFFVGNNGNVYGYYLTGYYFIFILFFSIVLGKITNTFLGKATVYLFLTILICFSLTSLSRYLGKDQDSWDTINLANQKRAIDEAYFLSKGEPFNLDFYVPPVIPYSYDYLMLWYGNGKYGYLPETEKVPLLITIYEIDPPHPDRIEAWFDRQDGIGKVEEEKFFGGIVVQKRERILFND